VDTIDETKGNSITLTISNIEAPSTVLAFDLSMSTHFHKLNPLKLNLIVENIPEPDPREAIKDVYPLPWEFDGTQPKFCDNLPSEKIIEAVNGLAVVKYNLQDWYEKAEIIANGLTVSSVPDLFSVMVHPTIPPENFTPWVWIQRVQFAVVFILAHVQEDWTVDSERNVLLAICYGPLDWPVNAAITVLAYMANKNSMIQDDVMKVFSDLIKRIPKQGYCFYTYALVSNMLRLSCVDGEFKEELLLWRKELEY